jgi:hypothetical protein
MVPHDCTRGSAYDCTAAAAHGTSDDCTGNRAAAELMRASCRAHDHDHDHDPALSIAAIPGNDEAQSRTVVAMAAQQRV